MINFTSIVPRKGAEPAAHKSHGQRQNKTAGTQNINACIGDTVKIAIHVLISWHYRPRAKHHANTRGAMKIC